MLICMGAKEKPHPDKSGCWKGEYVGEAGPCPEPTRFLRKQLQSFEMMCCNTIAVGLLPGFITGSGTKLVLQMCT